MSEIKIDIPEWVPLPALKRKIEALIKKEEMKWALFGKCKEELSLEKEDLEELELAREGTWMRNI